MAALGTETVRNRYRLNVRFGLAHVVQASLDRALSEETGLRRAGRFRSVGA